jgi:site-specific recombinase XerD
LRKYHGVLCKTRSKKNGELLQGATINDRFHSVKLLFSVLYRAGVITENPCAGLSLDLPKQRGVRRRPLTRDEITFFLEQFDINDRQGLKNRTMFELIYSSGLRVAETAALKIEDINLQRRTLIVRGKGDRDRMVPISIIARDMLTLYLGDSAIDGASWIFPGYKGCHLRATSISERFRTLLRKYDMAEYLLKSPTKTPCTSVGRYASSALRFIPSGTSMASRFPFPPSPS